jgi:uncharacterized protein (DUF1330 family)
MLRSAAMPSIEPSEEQLARLLAENDDGQPVVMINLLRFRYDAEYPAGFDAEPCSGREAYQRYGMAVLPMLGAVGGKILWQGEAKLVVIGPSEESWDEAILVQYPSRAAFLRMVTSEDYQKIVPHRMAALADSRLIATSTVLGYS